MREIKFRGKRVDNGEWVFGFFTNTKVPCIHISTIEVYEIDPQSLGQYAGFRDKHNKEVYENDIVEAWSAGSKGIFQIVFRQEGSPCWLLYPNGQHRQFWNIHVTEYNKEKQFISLEGNPYKSNKEGFYDMGLVVIGNIHDNPEQRKN